MTNRRSSKIVTTSWDDGNIADLRVAEILKSKGLKGTFYIPLQYRERSLADHQLRDLALEGFDIGAHSYSHQQLRGLSLEQLLREITPCKPSLEDATGAEVRMFCYPCGRYDSAAVRCLRQAGYFGARTTRMLATQLSFDCFAIPTTVQAFQHPSLTYFKNMAKAGRLEGLQTFLSELGRLSNWVELSKHLFDDVLQNGGVWHLYGHSWELERHGLWRALHDVLDYVSKRAGVQYLSNSDLIAMPDRA